MTVNDNGFKIDTGIPIPAGNGKGSTYMACTTMKDGDSIYFDVEKTATNFRMRGNKILEELGAPSMFISRSEGTGRRVWKVSSLRGK